MNTFYVISWCMSQVFLSTPTPGGMAPGYKCFDTEYQVASSTDGVVSFYKTLNASQQLSSQLFGVNQLEITTNFEIKPKE